MNRVTLRTPRLDLVCVDAHLCGLLENSGQLALALSASLPADWPPEFWDEAVPMVGAWIKSDPHLALGWGMWLFILRDEKLLIGDGGFKGAPDAAGRVDIGYSVVSSHQRKGLASEAVHAMCDWAFAQAGVSHVVGETFDSIPASIRVLEKCGFSFAGVATGHGGEAGVRRYVCRRAVS